MTDPINDVPVALPVLDLLASAGVIVGLLGLAGSISGIADPAFPLANALWFTTVLGGAFLLLATGPKLLLWRTSSLLYVAVFAILLGFAGAIQLYSAGFRYLIYDWLAMALSVGVLLLLLRGPSAWGIVGGLWSGLLLAAWSGIGIYSYLTTPTRIFSKLLPFQVLASVLAIVVAVMHLRLQHKRTLKQNV